MKICKNMKKPVPKWAERLYKQEHDTPTASRFYVLKLIKDSETGFNYKELQKELIEKIKLNNQKNPNFSFNFGSRGWDAVEGSDNYCLKSVLEDFEEEKLLVKGIINGSEKYLLSSKGAETLKENLKLVEENFLV